MAMTRARPTAASPAAITRKKNATNTPVGDCGCGPKRQKAMKFKLAAASISSMPIKMKIACRRLRAASRPVEKSAVESMRKSWRVGVIAQRLGLGSADVSRGNASPARIDRVPAMANFLKDCFYATPKPARETPALPRRRNLPLALLLHYQHEGANERGG